VSSHALALDRLEGCRFDVAVFTNLTRDHLDFHGNMEDYFGAKKLLFGLRKPGAPAVINAGDAYGASLPREVSTPVVPFSTGSGGADVRAEDVRCDLAGTSLSVVHASGRFPVSSPLLGRFNAENLLAASAAGLALGMSEPDIAEALGTVRRVPGRLEPV